jgi:tRNA-dihydrouridine synthase B
MNYRELLECQPVLPAPMCGLSDYAFRSLCRQMGAELTFTQMVSAEGLFRSDKKSMDILDLEDSEPGLAIQLFGANPETLAESAKILQDRGAALIDLNMGCPVRKVVASSAGAALLKDLPLAARIFRAMRAVTRVPLTVKMRWDWEGPQGAALEAGRIAEAEGLDGVCLHARTRAQTYAARAQWDLIARMKDALSIPVVGNGDIRRPADALGMMRTSRCDAVMIGRGLIGAPWLLRDALEAVRKGEAPEEYPPLDWAARRRFILTHAAMMFERHGAKGLVLFRKHASAYLKGVAGARHMRERMMRVTTMDGLVKDLEEEPVADQAGNG